MITKQGVRLNKLQDCTPLDINIYVVLDLRSYSICYYNPLKIRHGTMFNVYKQTKHKLSKA
ncbi:hypothetical protein PspMM1_09950 [Pseudoalteromonas sp. MM1]|nr:hypothetical protein PspMM1_09950 [Pseudoalteromonas sp. MM1]